MKNKRKLLVTALIMAIFGIVIMGIICYTKWYILPMLILVIGIYFIGKSYVQSTEVPYDLEQDESFDIFNDRNK